MFCRRRRNDWIAYCHATEPTGEVLVRDIWFFNHGYCSVRRLWKQIGVWNSQFAGDPNYKWFIDRRGRNI